MEIILNIIRLVEKMENKISGLVKKLDIRNIELNKKSHNHIEYKVDAFLCAYGLYSIYKGYANKKVFGSINEGAITIPNWAIYSN